MTLPTQNCDVVIATNTTTTTTTSSTSLHGHEHHNHHHLHHHPCLRITSMPSLADDNNDIIMGNTEAATTTIITSALNQQDVSQIVDCIAMDDGQTPMPQQATEYHQQQQQVEEDANSIVTETPDRLQEEDQTQAPTVTAAVDEDDDSDMFGPPRSAPLRLNRPRVPMISNKLRLREERKRILQLCANKLEKIKDSETNLRRSVCINNTYSRLTDEVRREKQSRYLANLPKCDTKLSEDDLTHERLGGAMMDDECRYNYANNINSSHCTNSVKGQPCSVHNRLTVPNQPMKPAAANLSSHHHHHQNAYDNSATSNHNNNNNSHNNNNNNYTCDVNRGGHQQFKENYRPSTPINVAAQPGSKSSAATRKRSLEYTDLETLDRQINELNAAMPPIDPEIMQGAEQLERALVSSRKRTRLIVAEEDNDRLVREALAHFYLPSPRLLSAIDDCPTTMATTTTTTGSVQQQLDMKRPRLMAGSTFGIGGAGPDSSSTLVDLDLNLVDTFNQSRQREFEVIMETLRVGGGGGGNGVGGSVSSSSVLHCGGGVMTGTVNGLCQNASDSCGQAAMLSEQGASSVFHNLVSVASLET